MAKAAKKKVAPGDVASNRQARHRFELLDKLECGMVLLGTEVKALREGGATLKDGYAQIRDGELWLLQRAHPAVRPGGARQPRARAPAQAARPPARDRAPGRQAAASAGLTLVPTRIYFKGPRAKIEIALAKGKDRFDKRQSIKERETKRDMDRALREANR